MNILQVISRLDSDGAGKDVLSSMRFFTLNGHKVIVVSPPSPLIKEIDQVGARHYVLNLSSNIFLIPFFISKLSKIIQKEDIDIAHSRDATSSFITFFAARFTGKTFVASVYEDSVRSIFKKAQFWAKHILTSSQSEMRRLVEKNFAVARKISVIPPVVDIDENFMKKIHGYFAIGALLPLSSYETRESLVRSISILTRAIHKLKIYITTLSSMHEEEYIEELKLLIRRHSVENIVEIISAKDTKNIIPELDLFLEVDKGGEASMRFLLGLEAHGIPILRTQTEGISSPQEIAVKIENLYKDEESRKKIGDAGKKFVRENFNIKKIMQSYLSIYENTVSSIKILIIKIGALGDAILATPSVRAVREKFPEAKIKLLTGIAQREVFMNCPFADDIMVCDFKKRDRGFGGLLRIARLLRTEDFDIVIDLQNNKRSHILAFLSCAPQRYGYDNGKLSFLLNRKIKDTEIAMDPVKHQSKVLGLMGIYDIEKKLDLWPNKEDEEWACNFLKSHWVKDNTPLVAINIGSSPRWTSKLWPVEYFVEVCNRLARDLGIRAILIDKEKATPRIKEFLKRAKCKPINAAGKTNVPRLATLIKKCQLLLTSDSAPMHVATSMDTAVLALFGPTDPRRHILPTKKNKVIKRNFPCQPCYHTRCDRGYVCMNSIKPDEVYEEIVKILEEKNLNKYRCPLAKLQ